MNERIKELAEQAHHITADELAHLQRVHNRTYDLNESAAIYNEKFAQLIVKECARLCEHESNDDEYDQYDMGQSVKAESIKTAIKEHFGVE